MTQNYKNRLLLPLILLAILYACISEHDYQADAKKPVEPLTVSGAMDWYNASADMLEKQKSTVDNPDEISYKPFGNLAELFTDELWYAVESPLDLGDRKLMIMTPEVSNYAETHGYDAIKQTMKLVVLRNKETGDTYSFIMAVIPELDYMLRKGDGLNEITYLSRDSDFDGYIFFYTLDGQLINGWLYKEGKVTGSINLSGDEKRTKIGQAMVVEVTVCGAYVVEYGGESSSGVDCHTYTEVAYVYSDTGYSFSGSGVNTQYLNLNGGSGNNSKLPLKPLPIDEDKQPEIRTDCSGSATTNATNAQNTLTATTDIKNKMNTLREYAKGKSNEFNTYIGSTNLGNYTIGPTVEGDWNSGNVDIFESTLYNVHTHTKSNNLSIIDYTGPSVEDIYNLLAANEYYTRSGYTNLRGIIIFAHDGSEYLLSINNRNTAYSFANNKLGLFESNDQGSFANKGMSDDYKSIFNNLKSNGYSIQDSNDYALSYLLDKYNTGLKISKKDKDENGFKETKTNIDSSNNYKPTICP